MRRLISFVALASEAVQILTASEAPDTSVGREGVRRRQTAIHQENIDFQDWKV